MAGTLLLAQFLSPSQWASQANPGDFARVWVLDTVNPYYLECLGARLRAETKWLHGASFWLPALAVPRALGKTSFVAMGSYFDTKGTAGYDYGDYCEMQVGAITVDSVHDHGYIGTGVRLAIFDSGFDLNHPSLRHIKGTDRVIAQHDFNSGDSAFTNKGTVGLPGFTAGHAVYINSMSLSVVLNMSVLAYGATSEDSVSTPGANSWNIYACFGDSAGSFGSPTKLTTVNYSIRPDVAYLSGDTFAIAWQAGTGLTVYYAKLRWNTSLADQVTIGNGIDPQLAGLGNLVDLFYYVDGDGLYASRSTDYGSTFSVGAVVIPGSDYAGADAVMVADTPVAAFSDGASLSLAWHDGTSWHTSFVALGTLPTLYVADSLYLAYWKSDTLYFGSASGPSGAFSFRAITATRMPTSPAVGRYSGTTAVAAEDSAGGITVFSKTGSSLASFGSAFSEKPKLARGILAWVRRGDPDATAPTEGPGHYHGTKTLSVIAGLSEHNLVGTGPGVDLLLGKTEKVVTTTGGSFENLVEEDFWVEGLEWAARYRAKVVNSSLGYRDWYYDPDMDGNTAPSSRAASMALAENILIFNSMGNISRTGPLPGPSVGDTSLGAPADAKDICAIAGVEFDSLNNIWAPSYSSAFGPSADGRTKPELVAPFTAIAASDTSFFGGSDTTFYLIFSGTSFSSALAAGACASVWEAHPSWSAEKMRQILLQTASPIPRYEDVNYLTGYGMLNAYAALNAEPVEVGAKDQDVLLPPWPNPFNPDVSSVMHFPYKMFHNSAVGSEIRVYTLDGLVVWEDSHATDAPGAEVPFTWDGRTKSGHKVQPGLYIVLLKTVYNTDVAKFAVVR